MIFAIVFQYYISIIFIYSLIVCRPEAFLTGAEESLPGLFVCLKHLLVIVPRDVFDSYFRQMLCHPFAGVRNGVKEVSQGDRMCGFVTPD
jgi:hypothetical protein